MAEQDMQRIGMTEDDLAMQESRAKRSDQAAAFASWLNSMRMKPDANLPAQLQAAQERRASNIRKNRTVNMLESAGQTELAKQVKSGAITGKTAVAQMFQLAAEERQAQRAAAGRASSERAAALAFERQKEMELFKAGLRGPELTAAMRNYRATLQDPEFAKFLQSGKVAEVGSIPQGYQLVEGRNEAGESVLRMEPIAGGPADVTKSEEAARERSLRTAGVITGSIDKIQERLKTTTLPVAGFVGGNLAKIKGTDAYSVKALVDTIKANIGFETLSQMRKESPTGGALGQVSNQEIGFLQATLANLDQGQKAEDFEAQLETLENIYNQVITKLNAYPEEAKRAAGYVDINLGGDKPKRQRYDAQGNLIDG
jgi:hypothetical protein